MIPVTKPFLPPKDEYDSYVSDIWERNYLTNNGPLVNSLEVKLKRYLGLDHILYVSNGTIALQIAIKALGLKGDIITTPFSYVATTSSIVWEGCNPIFVDIERDSYNIDPEKIEGAITTDTTAIMATHVFGNPCDVIRIKKIADKHNLKVIYDAAHAFSVFYKGDSIFDYGHISTTSFHATKLFHTIEGGAVFSNKADLIKRMARIRNFGHISSTEFDGVGINGKNSEFHAAMGLCNYKYIKEILSFRKRQFLFYKQKLKGLEVTYQKILPGTEYNYSYFPILFKSEELLLKATNSLEKSKIFCRRYFNPSLSKLNYVSDNSTPISDDISSRVLCLPLYHSLKEEEQEHICRLLLRIQNYTD